MPGRTILVAMSITFAAVTQAASAQAPSVTPFLSAPNTPTPNTFRAGEPISISTRILPADATGNVTFLIDGSPVQTIPVAARQFADTIALGDDIAYAGYIADPTQRYPALFAQSLHATSTTFATIGATACDLMPLQILPNNIATSSATSPLYTVLVGANDIANFGAGSHEAVFNLCHQAVLTWLGTPRSSKFLIGDPNVTIITGSWSPIPAPSSCCLNALNNTTGSGTLRFSIPVATAAYLWYVIDPNAPGAFTVSVDGGPPSTTIQTPPALVTASYGVLRIPAAPGNHTVDVQAQSGTLTILGMGTAPTGNAPTVLAADIPNQFGGDSAAIAAYTADIQANFALLAADGLDIRLVRTQQFLAAAPTEMIDTIRPNATGLAEIAQAFDAAGTSVGSTTAAAASYSATTLPVGPHTVEIAYSGDSKYPTAAAPTSTLTLYDGTSSTTLLTDAAIYPTLSPITLNASIPQSKASGQVLFSDESGPLGSAWLGEPTAGQAQLILPSLTAGPHTITAQYLGDITWNASGSTPVSITVSGAYTATTLITPTTRYFAGTSIPLTASVSPATASGTVTFSDGATTLAQSTLAAGSANLATSTLAPGIHSLTATYSGDFTQDPSTSPPLAIQIDPNPAFVSLTASPATAAYGTPIDIAASLQPSTATGGVTLLDGTQTLSQASLISGSTTFIAANLTPGTHTLTANYSGDTNDLPSTASITTQITLAPTTLTLAPLAATSTFGTPILFAATVSPLSATGTITLFDGSAVLAVIPLASGTASRSITTLTPGTHTITTTYSGDASYAPSTSVPASTLITPTSSNSVLAPLQATIYAGNPITLSATISPSSTTGTVLFTDAARGVLGQATIANGTATFTLPKPAVGPYSISATYSGDTDDSPATSAPVTTQVVLNPTSAVLTTSSNTAAFASPLSLTTNISPAIATGSATFFDGATLLGSAPVTNGNATLTTATLTPGTHTLHAAYSGDALYANSLSATVQVTITLASTTTTVTFAQNPVIANAQIIANVAVTGSTTNPTGTVTLGSGATTLAAAALANSSRGVAYATIPVPAAILGIGTFPLTAIYAGDTDNQPSRANASITIAAIPTLSALTLSAAQIPTQGTVTLTASVSANATGTITFLSNGTALATVPLTSNGTASYTFAPPSIATYSLTTAFTPTGLYAASTSAAQTLTVTPPLAASLAPASVTAGPGTTQSATLTLTPLSGFSGAIQSTCQASAIYVTCTAATPAIISSTTSVPVQIKVSTTSVAAASPHRPVAFTAALALLLPLLTRRKRARYLVSVGLLCAALCIAGCAEGGDFNSVPPGTQYVTITITAAGTPVTATVTLNIVD